MASKGSKVSTTRVAVCGLTSSSFNGRTGQGAGKSCLCNRFIHSTHDKLHLNHNSVINLSEYGSNIINNTHFLYWGEKVAALEDGQEIKFEIVEHTEFVDDSSLKPFSTTKPYHKRCTQLKLQSGGKVTYIEPDQLALPEQYTNVPKFPDKFVVDGFVACVDVSTLFNDLQKDSFERLLQNLYGTKKPVVVAFTKYDRAKEASVMAVGDLLGKFKKQAHTIEVSAFKGVNVDTCFLVLAHLIDKNKPKTKVVSYSDSKAQLDERIRRNEEALQTVLDERLTDFSTSLADACKSLSPIVEYQILIDLSGLERVHKLIKAKLKYLKQVLIRDKLAAFVEMLPHILMAMIPVLELGSDLASVKSLLEASDKFDKYFVRVQNWKENKEFLKSSEDQIPFEILEEEQAREVLKNYVEEALSRTKSKLAANKIKDTLENTSGILPGVDMLMLWMELGLSEEVRLVQGEEQVAIYNDYMGRLEQECVADLTELFLEKSEFFDQISSSPQETIELVHQELKDVPRYKRFDHRSQLRMSQALKHIGSLQMPEKSQIYGKSGLKDVIEKMDDEGVLSRDRLRPQSHFPGEGDTLQWILDPKDNCFNLSILARTEENAVTLRSDFMNHFSGSGTVEVEDRKYQIEMSLCHGNDISSLTSRDFVPQGAVAVVTSLECCDWLQELLTRLWLPGQQKDFDPPYRGMPLIILALDKNAIATDTPSSAIYVRSHSLGKELQCVCICEVPTPQPMRLVVTSVIHQILLSLVNSVSHLDEYFNIPLLPTDPMGLNIAVCTLVGDPYPNEAILNPLLHHQLISCNKGDHTLFVKTAFEKQHRTCVLSFHSVFNMTSLCSSVHLGFILLYSTQRPASLSVLKYLLPKLPRIPKMIVAMTTSKSHDKKLLEEGQELAKEWEAIFISNEGQDLPAGFAVNLFQKCWFSRFTSWKAQNMHQPSGRKQTRALPNRPVFSSTTPMPLPPAPSPPGISYSAGDLLLSPTKIKPGLPLADENEIYSNPVIKVRRGGGGGGERRKKSSLPLSPLSPPFLSPVHTEGGSIDLDASHGLSDYASVEDALKHTELSAGMVHSLRRQCRRSPSMSPPPPPPPMMSKPTSIAPVPEELGVDPQGMYDTVDPSYKKPTSPVRGGYDHLQPEEDQMQGYDKLQPDESPPTNRDGDGGGVPDAPPPLKGYDRLITPPSKPPVRPPRTDKKLSSSDGYAPIKRTPRPPAPSGRAWSDAPPDVYDTVEGEPPMYATIDTPLQGGGVASHDPVSELYATVQKKSERTPSPAPVPLPRTRPHPTPVHTPIPVPMVDDNLYSVVNKPKHRRMHSEDTILHQAIPVAHQAIPVTQSGDQPMYATVQKPRRPRPQPKPKPRRSVTPEEPTYSVPDKRDKKKTVSPQLTAVSAAAARPRNNISPTSQQRSIVRQSHLRSESFDTGLSHKPTRTHSMDSKHHLHDNKSPQWSPQMSSLRSPSPPIKTFSSLPNSYRNRARSREDMERTRSREDIERARSREELYRVQSRENSPQVKRYRVPLDNPSPNATPLIPERHYKPSELDLDDEAPPLPPRHYSWSDIEDNDEEIWQSDDDLDDPINSISIMEHQKIYSNIRRFSTHHSSVSSIEQIYNVVNRINLDDRLVRETTPPSSSSSPWSAPIPPDETLYDTLENVVQYSHPSPSHPSSPSYHTASSAMPTQSTEVGGASSAATPQQESMPLTPRDIKLIKQQQKLLIKLQKKMSREAEQRRRGEEKKRKREVEELRKKEGRKKNKKTKQISEERCRYFCSPLTSVVGDDGVPVFVHKCIHILEEKGINMEGLYRVSGKKEDCLTLQEKFDQDPLLDISSLGFYETCISSTLKAFFKLLPDPLIPISIAAKVLVINSLDADSQQTRIHEILNTMPHPNLCTLRCFVEHLHKVQLNKDINKMNASNLAIVFWPTLMRPPLMDLADPSKQMGWQLVMTRMIENPQLIPMDML